MERPAREAPARAHPTVPPIGRSLEYPSGMGWHAMNRLRDRAAETPATFQLAQHAMIPRIRGNATCNAPTVRQTPPGLQLTRGGCQRARPYMLSPTAESGEANGGRPVIPECGGKYATLPPGRHSATFDEVYERFVVEAPYRERRELIFRALDLHTTIIRTEFEGARIWLDGGFTTHKTWAEPEDADVVVVVPRDQYEKATKDDSLLPLWTLLGVTANQPNGTLTGKLHPMGGLMDVFCQPDVDVILDVWDQRWSLVKDENGELVEGATKGYLEVIL